MVVGDRRKKSEQGIKKTSDELGMRMRRWKWNCGQETDPSVLGTCSTGTKIGATVGNKKGKWRSDLRNNSRSTDTGDSGIGAARTHGTGLATESWFPDTLRAKGDFGVDASTLMTGVNNWFRKGHLGQ